VTTQANRQGRPWQRKDGRWATRAYVDGKPRTVYGTTEDEVLARQHEVETGQAPPPPDPYLGADQRNLPARPPKPVRVTIDLDQDRYRTLQAFRGTQITAAAVFRAFLDELDESNELAKRISDRIWAAKR
jgi:hypothetical protein